MYAEARAAWQRTANRCFVQEDAKRAPRLACCSSLPPSPEQDEMGPTSEASIQEFPSSNFLLFNQNPLHTNLSPNSRWWLQVRSNYMYQKGFIDEHFTPLEGTIEMNEDDSSLVDETSYVEFPFDNQYRSFMDKKDFKDAMDLGLDDGVKKLKDEDFVSFKVSKSSDDLYFDSESSWVGVGKNAPWWRTADTDELAFLVAQRSVDFLENCDLPMPQSTRVKKNPSSDEHCLRRDDVSTSLPIRNTGSGSQHHLYAHNSAPASLTAGSFCRKHRIAAEDKFMLGTVGILRDGPTHKMKPEMHASDEGTGKAQLLEALHHSQTRAREAEEVAKQACAERDHIVKLVLRQASQLFAYKQWLHLLQLENMYFQFPRTRRTRKDWSKSWSRKRTERARPRFYFGKYAIVFALGLGLVGAGLLLGWSIGWMIPTW